MYFLFVFNFICLGVDHDALVKLAEKQFSGLRSTYDEADVPEPCRFTGSEVPYPVLCFKF